MTEAYREGASGVVQLGMVALLHSKLGQQVDRGCSIHCLVHVCQVLHYRHCKSVHPAYTLSILVQTVKCECYCPCIRQAGLGLKALPECAPCKSYFHDAQMFYGVYISYSIVQSFIVIGTITAHVTLSLNHRTARV